MNDPMNASSPFTRIWAYVRRHHFGLITFALVGLVISLAVVLNDEGSSPSDAAARLLVEQPICDPNYRDICLDAAAPDYHCAGGRGDRLRYVSGPFRVVGADHFGLDPDGDGIACPRNGQLKPQPAPPPPNPHKAALEQTTKCLQGTPLLKVDTHGGTLSDLQVSAGVEIGGGRAQITVFSSHDQAVRYSRSFSDGAVGDLAAAVFTDKGTLNFQNAVEGCLG